MSRLLITIGREYGSGGREIGQKLAERLNIAFYDRKELQNIEKIMKMFNLSMKNFQSIVFFMQLP